MDNATINPEHLHDRHADRVGPDRRTDTENTELLVTMSWFLHKQVRSKSRALVKVKKHNNALSGLNVSEPFLVLFVNNYGAFRIGYSPMTGDLFNICPDNTYRCKLDFHLKIPLSLSPKGRGFTLYSPPLRGGDEGEGVIFMPLCVTL